MRPFFCVLMLRGSGAAFLFAAVTGWINGSSSSSESSVRSMTPPDDLVVTAEELPPARAEVEALPLVRDAFPLTFDRFDTASLSESESKIKTSSGSALTAVSLTSADAVALCSVGDGTGVRFACVGFPCSSIHFRDPYLLSVVCHSPFGSSSTSSTLSGVDLTIDSKNLLHA